MRTFKRILSVTLAILMILGSWVFADVFASEKKEARLYETYGNGMLFQQNEDIVFAGTGNGGSEIRVELYLGDTPVQRGLAYVNRSDKFRVQLNGLKGSYNEYTVVAYQDNLEFARLTNVVFGELWLANGQSNMQFNLGMTEKGEFLQNNNAGDYFIRVCSVPTAPAHTPFASNEPREDIPGCEWYNGKQSRMYSMSAVGYFFCERLRAELDVPVGFINTAIGGSSIFIWLSREHIENNPVLFDYIKGTEYYVRPDEVTQKINDQNIYDMMTYGYNQKIAPLSNFKIKGMIWYQGESNIEVPDVYSEALIELQKCYSELFGFENNDMPVIYSNIVACNYDYKEEEENSKYYVGVFNDMLSKTQLKNSDSLANITVYDVPLDYPEVLGALHPIKKEPIANRMGTAAMNMVYGGDGEYTAPYVSDYHTEGKYLYVDFGSVGNGLRAGVHIDKAYITREEDENNLYGFTVSGADGQYLEAKAEIVDKDTIRIWNDTVANPVSATYAYSLYNTTSNLFGTNGKNETIFPVSVFKVGNVENSKYMTEKIWTTCDTSEIFLCSDDDDEQYFDAWNIPRFYTAKEKISYNSVDKAEGTASLQVDFITWLKGKTEIAVQPSTYQDKIFYRNMFCGQDKDYSNLTSMSFKVKNISDRPVTFKCVQFTDKGFVNYVPAIRGTKSTSVVLAPQSGWQTITVDLTKLYINGDTQMPAKSSEVLKLVNGIRLVFDDKTAEPGDKGAILLDDFTFAANEEPTPIEKVDFWSVLHIIKVIFERIIKIF